EGVGARTDRGEVARPARVEQRFLDLGTIGERVDDDIERAVAEILLQALRQSGDREIAHVLVALVAANLLRSLRQRVERGIEGIDLRGGGGGGGGGGARFVDLAALEQV